MKPNIFLAILALTVATTAGALFIGSPVASAQSLSGVGGANDVAELSWKHDLDGAGPLQPVDVSVKTKLRQDETIADFALRFRQMVEEMAAAFPPNVGPSTG